MRYESYVAQQDKFVARQKCPLTWYFTCRATSFECLRHIHHNLRQSMTYPSMTLKPYSLSYFEHNSNWYFSIYSLWRYIMNCIIWKKSTGGHLAAATIDEYSMMSHLPRQRKNWSIMASGRNCRWSLLNRLEGTYLLPSYKLLKIFWSLSGSGIDKCINIEF